MHIQSVKTLHSDYLSVKQWRINRASRSKLSYCVHRGCRHFNLLQCFVSCFILYKSLRIISGHCRPLWVFISIIHVQNVKNYIKSLVSIWQKFDEASESDHYFTAPFSTSSAFLHQITQEISDSTRIFRLLGSDRWETLTCQHFLTVSYLSHTHGHTFRSLLTLSLMSHH